MRSIKFAAPAAFAAVVVLVVANAGGTETVGRDDAGRSLAERYHVFGVSQKADDVFKSDVAAYAATAEKIATTSRKVSADAQGDAFAFLNDDNRVCLLYRPVDRSFGASSCGPADGDGSPAVLVHFGPRTTTALVAGLLQQGAGEVVVSDAEGVRKVPVEATGGFVYRGRTPFTVQWKEASGRQRTVKARDFDVTKLKRVG